MSYEEGILLNKIKVLGYKVAFFNATAIILVVFAISLMITNQMCSNIFDRYIYKEKQLVDSVRVYKNASDYLTKKAFAYVDTGDVRYYKHYMREAYNVKRREMSVNNIKNIGIIAEGEAFIDLIHNYSMELMALEEAAMELVRDGKIDKAKEKLFSDDYEKKADSLASEVMRFERLVRKDIEKHLNVLQRIIDVTFAGEIVISLIIVVVSPLRNKMTMNLLYVDSLTNMENRVAFEKYIAVNENRIKGMAFIDVNELKHANDNLGHKAGDSLLVNVAKCIKNVFKEYGRPYRISGDEFVVVLEKDIDEKALLDEFNRECEEMSDRIDSKISASCGFAIQDFSNPISKEDLYVISEKNMYEAKSNFYKESGIDRRGHRQI